MEQKIHTSPCRSSTTRFHSWSHERSEINKAKMNTKCNEEVAIKFRVSSLSVFFIRFPLLRNWKKRSELGVRIFVHSERKLVARVCSCFLSLSYTLSLAMNKVSLNGARAPSPAAISHWTHTVQQTPPANITVPTVSVHLNFTQHATRGFSQWKG
jgi:hypothetical protein